MLVPIGFLLPKSLKSTRPGAPPASPPTSPCHADGTPCVELTPEQKAQIATGSQVISNESLRQSVAKLWELREKQRLTHLENGGTICPLCKTLLKTNEPCAVCAKNALKMREKRVFSALRRAPWLRYSELTTAIPELTFAEFSTACAKIKAKIKGNIWEVMNSLDAGAPLTAKIRNGVLYLVALQLHKRTTNVSEALLVSIVGPKLATAYLTNAACPRAPRWQSAPTRG